jgi:hypothetical protein
VNCRLSRKGASIPRLLAVGLAWLGACVATDVAHGQITPPRYEELRLDSVFPAGGRRGESVVVEFRGTQEGLQQPRAIVMDGPPGVIARNIESVNASVVRATLEISPDAPPGRRWLRVASEQSGLTNFAAFVVGELPEGVEQEPNDERSRAMKVETPIVINGSITPQADADYFRFAASKGQNLVVAIAAHSLDIHGQGKNFGIADYHLELFDAAGRVVAEAEDTLGLDPLIEYRVEQAGEYVVKVGLLNHQGFPDAVYRLTVGEVPYVTSVFPAGGRRGEVTEVELSGPNIPVGTRRQISSPSEPSNSWLPWGYVTWSGEQTKGTASSGCDVPVAWNDWPEQLEREPNNRQAEATLINWSVTMNGRLAEPGDEDWFRVDLPMGKPVWFETMAHRFLRSPIDTRIELYDSAGKLVGENDDDAVVEPGYESIHDYRTTDSRLRFQAPLAGTYWVRVRDAAASGNARGVYRLIVRAAEPEFELRHYPDGVPVWGPGGTASVVVRIDRLAGFNGDVELSIEGLPAGWRSSRAVSLGVTAERPLNAYQNKILLTMTAPVDAKPGDWSEMRIIGRTKREDGSVGERCSWPLTWFYTSDTGFFRVAPVGRVAVARPLGITLEALVDEVTAPVKGQVMIPVRVARQPGTSESQMELWRELSLVTNLAGPGVGCGLTTPRSLAVREGRVEVPVQLPPEIYPGEYGVTVALTWRSDIRVGLPGPCTSLVRLKVK